LIILPVLLLSTFLISCKTTEKIIYIRPVFIHPEIDPIPVKEYLDGGFALVDPSDENSDLIISETDAKILAKYLVDLKEWGNTGWTWTDYYKEESKRLDKDFQTGE